MNYMESRIPVLIHTDMTRISRDIFKSDNLYQHIFQLPYDHLKSVFVDFELWFPAFNYDFAKSKLFKVDHDPVQVGSFNEWVRQTKNYSRSQVPIFSILREVNKTATSTQSDFRPFSKAGEFGELVSRKGQILLFGARLNSLTFIHYVEELLEIPYKYNKTFYGYIEFKSNTSPVSTTYLVRPMGLNLEYDWNKVHKILIDNSIPQKISTLGNYELYDSKNLSDFMVDMYKKDIMWTLTEESRVEVSKELDRLGRNFQNSDFEKN
jgi:aminoglycoside N3'-acetyltransferase